MRPLIQLPITIVLPWPSHVPHKALLLLRSPMLPCASNSHTFYRTGSQRSLVACLSKLAVLSYVPLWSVLLLHSNRLSGGSLLRDSLFSKVCLRSTLLHCSIVDPESSHLVLLNSFSAQPSPLRQRAFCQLFL